MCGCAYCTKLLPTPALSCCPTCDQAIEKRDAALGRVNDFNSSADRVRQLEQDLADAISVITVLVARAGGEVSITRKELDGLPLVPRLRRWDNRVSHDLVIGLDI